MGPTRVLLIAAMSVALAFAAEGLSTFSEIVAYVERNPAVSLDELFAKLSPEIRGRYQLVYETRSPIGASLEKPRIVLTSGDGKLLLGLASDSSAAGGNQLEVIEYDEAGSRARFRRITFGGDGAKIERDPPRCLNCHGNPKAKRGFGRPIWDGYPDWPGTYGSSHNDMMMGRSDRGTSGVPDLEFEVRAFEELKRNAGKSPRLSALIGLSERTLPEMADLSGKFTESLFSLQMMNLIGVLAERAREIYRASPEEYARIRSRGLQILGYEEGRDQVAYEALATDIESRITAFYEKKRERIFRLIKKHGTENDRRLLTMPFPVTANKAYFGDVGPKNTRISAFGLKHKYGAVSIERLFKLFDLDTGGLAIARELGASTFNLPNSIAPLHDFESRALALLMEPIPGDPRTLGCANLVRPMDPRPGK